MGQTTPEITLAGGLKIFYANRQEVEFLWEEMPAYFRHGIAIRPGDTVLDVGANIGLFSLYASRLSHHQATIFAFEPIPTTFEILQRNIERHRLHNIHAFPFGLSLKAQTANLCRCIRIAPAGAPCIRTNRWPSGSC
jgi:predicted O-methyltransferase YrrM